MHQFRTSIESELQLFAQFFDNAMKSEIPLLDKILSHLAKSKGKQIRPMFVLLCAGLGGPINESSYRAALFVEILHTSSLVHDDLVDDSAKRRGAFSVNTLWKNRAAVFTGDNLFTRSVLLLLNNNDHRILKIFADSIEKVIEGELLQMDKSRKINLDEDVYFEIIKGKTATLLASACAAGAASTCKEDSLIQKLYSFGEKVGIAFQIKDDLLDYSSSDIGKPTGNDIKEKKVTLPLLYTLNRCTPSLKKDLIRSIKNSKEADIAKLKTEIEIHGGFEYAEQKMLLYRNDALEILHDFPESIIRSALEELVFYVTGRMK